MRELIRRSGAPRGEAYFWGVHTGAELDFLILQNGQGVGFEIKLTRFPKVTAAMRPAREALNLEQLHVICHGEGAPRPLSDGITAVPVASLDTCVTDSRNIAPLLIPTDQTCP